MSTPYASASSGEAARTEITKILRKFGCESVGFMDDFEKHEVLLVFTHRGRPVQLCASAKGWAQLFVKKIRGRTGTAVLAQGSTMNGARCGRVRLPSIRSCVTGSRDR